MFTGLRSGIKDQSAFSLFGLSRNKIQTKTQEINLSTLRLQSSHRENKDPTGPWREWNPGGEVILSLQRSHS